jgi:AbrB family looped-hinge helix DNA binding protein
VADRAVIRALGWRGGDRLTLTAEAGVVSARRDPGGMVTVPARAYIAIPAALRRRCGLEPGDRVLLAAVPGDDVLAAYSLAVERRGLVQRRRLGDDRKSLAVAVTAKGTELLGRAEVTLMREQDAVLEGFTPSELGQFAGFLDRFERAYSSRLAAGVA